jgi:uncharacterized membrane protein YgcG
MALLTIQALPCVSIEEYSLTIANGWALGREGFDDGLLITWRTTTNGPELIHTNCRVDW